MKQALTFLILLSSFCSFSQYTPVYNPIKWKKGRFDTLRIPFSDTVRPKDDLTPGQMMIAPDKVVYVWDGAKYVTLGSGEGGDFQLGIDTPFLKSINNVLSINTRGLNNYAGTINVRDYGAKGDGVTDDYLFIQSAFNAAKDGATVIFPSGYTFYTSGGLNVNKRVSIIATGAVIRLKNSSTVKGMLTLNAKGSTVTGGQWDYNKANGNIGDITTEDPYYAFGVLFNADSCTVQNASFVNFWGMAVKSASKSYGSVINCDINSEIYGVFFDGYPGINPTGNKAIGNRIYQRGYGKYAQGILFTAYSPAYQQNAYIADNYCVGPKDTTGFGPVIDQAIAIAVRGSRTISSNNAFYHNITRGYVMGISEGGVGASYSNDDIDSLIGISYGLEPSGTFTSNGDQIRGAKRAISANSAFASYDNSVISNPQFEADIAIELQIASGQTGHNIVVDGGVLNVKERGITTTRDIRGLKVSTTIVGPGSTVAGTRALYLNSAPDSAYVTFQNSKVTGFERWSSVYQLSPKTVSFLNAQNNDFSKDVASAENGWFAEGVATLGSKVSATNNATSVGNKKSILDQAAGVVVMYDDSYSTPEGNINAGIGSMYYSLLNGGQIYRKETGTGASGWQPIKTPPLAIGFGDPFYVQRVNSAGTALENALISAPSHNRHVAVETGLEVVGGTWNRLDSLDGLGIVFDSTTTGHHGAHLQSFRGYPITLNDKGNNPVEINNIPFNNVLGVMTIGSKVAGQDATASNQFVTKAQLDASTAGLRTSTTTTTSTYTVAAGIKVVFSNYSGGTATITLPSAASNLDQEITIKNVTSNNVMVTPISANDANTILGYGAVTVKSDGTTWYAISKY
jgi:hypothetical protein